MADQSARMQPRAARLHETRPDNLFCFFSPHTSTLPTLLVPTRSTATMDSPIPGLDSPAPRRRDDSPFRMDITPLRANQVNLFFSPGPEDDVEAAEGTYVRKTTIPEVYTRTARRVVDDEESDEETPAVEEQPSKKQRTNATGGSGAAARLAASRRPADARTSALSLFDEHDDFMQQSAQQPGDQTESFDPLKGPVGMMSSTPGIDDDGGEKKRRTRPKLDVERYVLLFAVHEMVLLILVRRLLSDRGLPALIKDAKRFRIRGKGHEVRLSFFVFPCWRPSLITSRPRSKAKDLNNLLSTYQMWTHQLFPIMPFTETVARVETLCHSKLVKVSLSSFLAIMTA
jgi:hypothetical protein